MFTASDILVLYKMSKKEKKDLIFSRVFDIICRSAFETAAQNIENALGSWMKHPYGEVPKLAEGAPLERE